MLTIQNLSMGFGGRMLFENVTAKFGEGFRYGIVGANGCGKSTFMRILAGGQEPLAGSISLGNGERLAWLRQDQFAYEDHLVLDVVMMGHQEMWECQQKKDAIYANPDASEENYLEASQLEARFAELGGYTAPAQAATLLQGVGIAADLHDKPMKAVPSGWKLRVLLAQALFANPDILLLDEPTNHLDLHTITWLEQTLNQKEGTILIISHDRHFLNEVCTHMVDVDYHTLTTYPGNYDDFMEAAALARQRQLSVQSRNKDRIAELEEFVRRFRAHKAKARQATSRMKQIEKLRVEDVKPSSRQYPFIRFGYPPKDKLYRQALQVSDLGFAYPGQAPLFKNFSLSVEAGEKIAIIGPNGRGKTTLLKLIAGELTPTSGQIRWSEKAKLGVLPQEHGDLFSSQQTLIDWLNVYWTPNDSGMEPEQQIRSILGRLLFSGDEVKKSVNVLSGGEQMKMLFGRLMLSQANVLLLDEPTNHLDMEAIEALNAALEQFPGTVLVASHDRELVSSLAQRVVAFTPEGLQDTDLESALSVSALA